MSRVSRDFDRVPLAAAAALVLFRVTGTQAEQLTHAEMARSLNSVARALSNLAQIYAGEPPENAGGITPLELLGGHFQGGAKVFRTRDGREFHPLAIDRCEMLAAIRVLRAARIRFN